MAERIRAALRRSRRGIGLAVTNPTQGLLLARMLAWRVVLPVLKRAVPLPSLVRLMWSDARLPEGVQAETVVRLSEVVYKASPQGERGNCYERGLVVYRYLARAGADPTLVVGVDRPNGDVRGHVWVLLDGRPVHDSPERLVDHAPLASFGAGGKRTEHAAPSTLAPTGT